MAIGKEEYAQLVERVSGFDLEAAQHLGKMSEVTGCNFVYSGNLACAFIWESTPQGREYWADIFEKLEGANER